MKKNKLFLIGLVTVFVALLSLTLVSSTFARYVTTGEGTASARVAKWGVTVTVKGDETFKNEYATDDTDVKDDITTSVKSTVDVVAPGTNGTFANIKVEGTPEVAVKIEQDAEVTLEGWTVKNGDTDEFYCPLVFTVGGTGATTDPVIKGSDFTSAANLVAAIKAALEINKNFAVGADITSNYSLSWKWEFNGASADADAKDTQLGNLATAPTIIITIKTTVTQID